MASIPTLFDDFLSNIRPQDYHIEDYKKGHKRLREKLQDDDSISDMALSS